MKKGFSLVEVVVSIALVALVMSLVISLLVISSNASKREDDKRSAWRIVHNIHQAYLSEGINFNTDTYYMDESLTLTLTDIYNAKYIIYIEVIERDKYKELFIKKIMNNENKEIIKDVYLGKVLIWKIKDLYLYQVLFY